MSNLSILQHNILDGFGPHARDAFLKALNKTALPTAERFANEVQQLTEFCEPALALTVQAYSELDGRDFDAARSEVLDFILTRHWFYRFPNASRVSP